MYDMYFFDPSLTLKGTVSAYASAKFTKKLREAGDFEITTSQLATDLKPDDIIYIRTSHHCVGIVEQIELTEERNTLAYKIKGKSILTLLSRRLGLQQLSPIVYTNQPIETVIKNTVAICFVNGETSRRISNFTVADSQQRGSVLPSFTTDVKKDLLKNFGSELVYKNGETELSVQNPFGLDLTIDFKAKQFIFDIINPTVHYSTSPAPVIFATKYDNVSSIYTIQSAIGEYNAAYFEDTAIRPIGTGAGFGRKEIFIDKDTQGEALADFAKLNASLMMSAEVERSATFVYGVDYRLGDYVEVIHGNLLVKTQITEVNETIDHEGYALSLSFGDSLSEKIDHLKKVKGV